MTTSPMRLSIRVAAYAGVLLALAVPAAAQEDPRAEGVVALRFGWRSGLRAAVSATSLQIRDDGDGPDTTLSILTYRMIVKERPSGLVVEYSDFAAPGQSMTASPETWGALIPGYRVSREGVFLGLTDFARMRPLLDSVMQSTVGSLDEMPPETRAFLERATSEEVVSARAAEDWNAMVGFWLDGALEMGQWYTFESDEPVPLIPGATVPMVYEFRAAEPAPCSAADQQQPQCVRLELNSAPKAEAMARLIAEILTQAGAGAMADQIVYERLEYGNEIILVAEPATLVPYYVEIVRTGEGTGRGPGGEVGTFSIVRARSFEFRYDGTPGKR